MFITDRTVSDRAEAASPAPHVLEARTRDRVRQAISEDGPLTATALAARLGLTPAAVRRHLDRLVGTGAIDEHEPAGQVAAGGRGRGRPARAYVLSEAGHATMDSDYDDVATSALRFLTDRAGAEAVAEFARDRIAEFEQRYAAQLAEAGDSVAARANVLATALTVDGFAASTRPMGSGTAMAGVQLCQGHCPVQHVAAEFPQFCDAETDAFSRMLGVHVQRLATLAHGEHVCTTFVPLTAAAGQRPVAGETSEASPASEASQTSEASQILSRTTTSDGRSTL